MTDKAVSDLEGILDFLLFTPVIWFFVHIWDAVLAALVVWKVSHP